LRVSENVWECARVYEDSVGLCGSVRESARESVGVCVRELPGVCGSVLEGVRESA
jgi:hypothetical protein